MQNPLLEVQFEIPFDEIRPEHVVSAMDQLLEEAKQSMEAIASKKKFTWLSTFEAYEKSTEKLEYAMGIVEHLESVASTPELREVYNEVKPKVSAFWSSIPTNERLYKSLLAFSQTEEARAISEIQERLVDKTLTGFRRHGVELNEEGKQLLKEIDVALAKHTMAFSQNLLDETAAFELILEDEKRLEGLPKSAKQAARQDAEQKGKAGWRFTLQAPSLIPVLTYAEDEDLRKEIWKAYNTRATQGEKNNFAHIESILKLRKKKAELLGYKDFSDFVTEDRMAKSGEKAFSFIEQLREKTQAQFLKENQELKSFAQTECKKRGELNPWDVGFYAEKQRKAFFDFDDEELKPYFPVNQVLEGLFVVVKKLYGIKIEKTELQVWHESVQTFSVLNAENQKLASFYVDLYPREEKRGGAWMNAFITGGPAEDGFNPHLGLFCANATPPIGDQPALLTHNDVETLFHEFGHLMHHCLSEVSLKSLAGTNVAWDFVELPSQIMENWTWEREALDLFAKHYETGETIPDALFGKMINARNFRSANATMRQLGFSTVDLKLHQEFDAQKNESVQAYSKKVLQNFMPTILPDDYGMLAGFGHIFSDSVGYAAGYYSYKWAEVLDADAFGRFKEEGIFNAEVGAAFRTEILSKGDSEDPEILFEKFRGRAPETDALLQRSGLTQ